MIEVKNISLAFNTQQVLKNVSVSFEQGKTNLIIGRSGSGKTVLLKSIVGLLIPDSGEIWYGDNNFTNMDSEGKRAVRQNIGMLFQGSALFDSMTVEENVMFPLNMFTSQSREQKLDRANACLARVNILNANKLLPSELSGGMQKRVAIARAIALNPEFLFCDEPNSGLDPLTSILIDNLIKEITDEFNMTTIVNTHDMNSVMEIGEKIVFMSGGKLWWEGTKEEILNVDCNPLNDFVFASNLTRKLKT